MNMVVNTSNLQQFSILSSNDSADVTVQLVLPRRRDPSFSILRAVDDVKQEIRVMAKECVAGVLLSFGRISQPSPFRGQGCPMTSSIMS